MTTKTASEIYKTTGPKISDVMTDLRREHNRLRKRIDELLSSLVAGPDAVNTTLLADNRRLRQINAELLEALEAAESFMRTIEYGRVIGKGGAVEGSAAIVEIRAAIARAEGKA